MNTTILNRESIAPRIPTWQQIEATGDHRALLDSERIVQVIDETAIRNIVSEWEKDMKVPHFAGLLVDADHLSHDPAQSTEAKAWLVEVAIRNGQLYGLLDWTDTGAAAVQGKRWKFFSTEYNAGDLEDLGAGPDGVRRVRPRRLAGLALTNRPNNRGGRPITNRKATEAEHTQPKTIPMNKTALEKLGLPETATDEEFNAKLDELIARAGKADEMETDAAAEEILNRHAKRISEGTRGEWKKGLIANRESTEAILAKLPESSAPPRIFNREKAATPGVERGHTRDESEGDEIANKEAATQRASRIRNRTEEIKRTQRVSHRQAWDLAEAEVGK